MKNWLIRRSTGLKNGLAKLRKVGRAALPFFAWVLALGWVAFALFVILAPQKAIEWDYFNASQQWTNIAGPDADPSALLRNLGWLLITAIGLPLIIWRSVIAQRQLDVAQKGQFSDRYAKAAAMLSDESMAVREAGIFALRELAIADPNGHYFPVQDLFCSFLRDKAKAESDKTDPEEGDDKEKAAPVPPCPSDSNAALIALSDLRTKENRKREEKRNWRPKLQKVNLDRCPGSDDELNLQRANLFGAHLEGAILRHAHLEGAYLIYAHLEGAYLRHAHLEGAELISAHLEGADLGEAHLEGAYLRGANLVVANLRDTHLEGANLRGAHLEKADLRGARLERAILRGARLEGAIFSPPVWPAGQWPEGFHPSEIKHRKTFLGEWEDYFTFLPNADSEGGDKT